MLLVSKRNVQRNRVFNIQHIIRRNTSQWQTYRSHDKIHWRLDKIDLKHVKHLDVHYFLDWSLEGGMWKIIIDKKDHVIVEIRFLCSSLWLGNFLDIFSAISRSFNYIWELRTICPRYHQSRISNDIQNVLAIVNILLIGSSTQKIVYEVKVPIEEILSCRNNNC